MATIVVQGPSAPVEETSILYPVIDGSTKYSTFSSGPVTGPITGGYQLNSITVAPLVVAVKFVGGFGPAELLVESMVNAGGVSPSDMVVTMSGPSASFSDEQVGVPEKRAKFRGNDLK